jgi:hypothetical protein
MPVTTDRVIDFAKDAFKRHLEELLDDPTWLLNEPDLDPVEYIAEQRRIAADLLLDFDALVDELGTPSEIDRLQRYSVREFSSGRRI